MQLEQFPLQTRRPSSGSNSSPSSLSRFSVTVTEDFPDVYGILRNERACFNTSSSTSASEARQRMKNESVSVKL